MERKTIQELEEMKKFQLTEIDRIHNEIDHINIKIYDQRMYDHYSELFVSIDVNREIPQYDFFKLIYKSLPKKFKKLNHVRSGITSSFRMSDNDFFKLGEHIFNVGNGGNVFNIEKFIEEQPDFDLLMIKNQYTKKRQESYQEDKDRFYNNLKKNLNKHIELHAEYFI